MRPGAVRSREEIVQPGFHDHASAVVFGELQEFPAEPVPLADNRVDKVLGRLSLNRNLALQTGQGIIPSR